MSYKISDPLAANLLAAVKDGLDGGLLYLFAGPVPGTPADALNMVSSHTELAKVAVDGDGATGLTFAAPAGALLSKTEGESWSATAAFDGAEDTTAELPATFFRFCPTGDDGRGAGAGARLQGTIGPVGSQADMERSTNVIHVGAPVDIAVFVVRVGSIG